MLNVNVAQGLKPHVESWLQMFYGLHLAASPLPVSIAPASPHATTSATLSSGSFVTVATAGLATEILLTMRDAGANVVDCRADDLSVWVSGRSHAAAVVTRDAYGACRAVFSVLEVRLVMVGARCIWHSLWRVACDV